MNDTAQRKESLVVIASYPPKGEKHSSAIVGGAMYAKNTLQAVIRAAQERGSAPEITVLAENLKRHSRENENPDSHFRENDKIEYIEDGIHIKRFWERSSLHAYTSLLKEIFRNHQETRTIVIEFEFAMFGDRSSLLPLPLFLLLLRLRGKRVIFVFHQVVENIADIGGHLNLKESGLKTSLMNVFLQTLYAVLLFLSHEVIVFEEVLKKRLSRWGRAKKITVVPFGTEIFPTELTRSEARKALTLPEDTFIVFIFGFLAWYKGSDWLVETFNKHMENGKHHSPNIQIILGGGGNPNHMNKPYYAAYIHDVKEKAARAGILVTDFIPEAALPHYFQTADLVLLPYRTLMSSSGPLSLAFSFRKPFLLSTAFRPLFMTADIQQALKKSHLTTDDLTFPLDTSFPDRLQEIAENKALLERITELSATIAEHRSWREIGKRYYDIFFKQ